MKKLGLRICVTMLAALSTSANADDIEIDKYLGSTLSGIKSISCDFRVVASDIAIENMTGKFNCVLSDSKVAKLHTTFYVKGVRKEYIVQGGRHYDYNGQAKTLTVNMDVDTQFTYGNPLFYSLIVTRVKDKPYFDHIMKSLQESKYKPASVSVEGAFKGAIYIKGDYGDTEQILGFSPGHNYMPCYRKLTPLATKDWVEDRVESFQEVVKGVYFPSVIQRKAFHPVTKKEYNKTQINFTNIKVNSTIPEDAFLFKYSNGDVVYDRVKQQVFRVGNDGVPRNDKMQLFDYATQVSSETGKTVQGDVVPEGWSIFTYFVLALSVFLGVIAVFAIRRMIRKSRQPNS